MRDPLGLSALHNLRRAGREKWTHLRELAPKALLVTCVVTILHFNMPWFRATEVSLYVLISNLNTRMDMASITPKVVVAEIDSLTFERRYHERSPLNRCVLMEELKQVYDAKPTVVAIDLDLSPATWPEEESATQASLHTAGLSQGATDPCRQGEGTAQCEPACQDALYTLIQERAKPSGKFEGTATVLLEPFIGVDPAARAAREIWRERMLERGNGRVLFADGNIPTELGMELRFPSGSHSFAQIVRSLAGDCATGSKTELPCVEEDADQRALINPKTYLNVRPVELQDFGDSTRRTTRFATVKEELITALNAPAAMDHGASKVVFFGGAYGTDDLFETPIGRLYGVEAHAGAYLNRRIYPREAIDFAADWILAVLFGWLAIGDLWKRYFKARFSGSALKGAVAPLFIVHLVVRVVLMLFVLVLLAMVMFRAFSLWLSPIPLAIGMLFDSFVAGSVDGAVDAHQCRGALLHRARGEPRGPDILSDQQVIAAHASRKLIAGNAETRVHAYTRRRVEPPVSEWIRGTWRLTRLLILFWAALLVISSLVS